MSEDLAGLIEDLALWRAADTGFDEVSSRHRAIAALLERGPDVVPALIERLQDLLDTTTRHRARVAAVREAWDAWYEEGDRLIDEHGLGADVEPYRTVPTASLPQPSPEDDQFRDPFDLKQGIIEALRQFGDPRAGAVLGASLGDPACVPAAAGALRDIQYDGAVPALLDAAAAGKPDDSSIREVLATLQHYGVSMAQARTRFDAETSPQGRVSLMRLLTKLADDSSPPTPSSDHGTRPPEESLIRDSLIFLALDDRDTVGRWSAIRALDELDNRTPDRPAHLSAMDAPPSADTIRSAIELAAHEKPFGHDRELTRRIRKFARTLSASQAVTAVLTEDSPRPDDAELRLALRLALQVDTSAVEAPMQLLRALHRLSSHAPVADGALLVLRRDRLLFRMMVQDDDTLRAEARTIFEAIAEPEDRARFARFTASQPGRWAKLVGRLRRR
jgi:hypothetical protein